MNYAYKAMLTRWSWLGLWLFLDCSGGQTGQPTSASGGGQGGGPPSSDCQEGDRSYVHGTTWICSDGCNQCSCSNGTVVVVEHDCAAGAGGSGGQGGVSGAGGDG